MTLSGDDTYNPSVMTARLHWISLAWGLAVGSVFADVETKSKDAPVPPPGYKSKLEIMVAFGNGKLEIIDRDVSLPDGVVLERDIEYGNADGHSLQLDLYRPATIANPVPALLFIHGGAWKSGKRQDYHFYTAAYAKKGYVVATASYRLSGQAPFPAAVQDCKCAIRWLRANAKKYKINPDQIAAVGGSAGGHLSMMLGYSNDPELEGESGNRGVSSRVSAVVNIYGVYDMTTQIAKDDDSVRSFLQGKSFEEAPELYRESSPRFHLDKTDPPTLILHGTIDETVPVGQSDSLAAHLKRLKIPHAYGRLDGWPHTMDIAKPVNDYCQSMMDRFFATHLPLPGKKH
ncbi:MAG: alpha/beta hydrolase [Pedosphaera sp.]|nr:alpha/beta hydrolase [Pedosphaera sp.]